MNLNTSNKSNSPTTTLSLGRKTSFEEEEENNGKVNLEEQKIGLKID